MTDMNVAPWKWSARCAILLSAAALLTAAPASAEQTDDAFIAALAKGGISMSDRSSAIGMAYAVCAGLDANRTSSVLAMKLVNDTNLSPRQSGYFIGLSVAAYCPEYKGKLDGSLNWLRPGPPLM